MAQRLLIVIFLCHWQLPGASRFFLREGDTLIFYGDSITHQRLYTCYVEAFVLTRFPHMRLRFVQSGWGGDRVSGGGLGAIDERLDRDVFAYNPTVITVMLGMNDGEYRAFDPEIFRKYTTGYQHIVDRIRSAAPGARLTVLEPSPYDDVTRPPKFARGYNSVLLRYGSFVKGLALAQQLTEADLNAPVVDLLKEAKRFSEERAPELIPDRVHPSPGVHLVMAGALLKAWNAPSTIASVELDAATGRLIQAENARVDSIKTGDGITWREIDASLPMPLDGDSTIELALRCSGVYRSLNKETLKLTGLRPGGYRVRIDNSDIGVFDSEKLGKGIELAVLDTPMASQAKRVLRLTFQHNVLHYARWAMVETSLKTYNLPQTPVAAKELDRLEQDVVTLQRAEALPKPHIFQVVPVKRN